MKNVTKSTSKKGLVKGNAPVVKASPVIASPAPVTTPAPVAPETITIAQIARLVNRSPKVLRAIARNEAYRVDAGKGRRLPAPVAKHVYAMKDLEAFKVAIAKEA